MRENIYLLIVTLLVSVFIILEIETIRYIVILLSLAQLGIGIIMLFYPDEFRATTVGSWFLSPNPNTIWLVVNVIFISMMLSAVGWMFAAFALPFSAVFMHSAHKDYLIEMDSVDV
jgi:hypothetical protein